MVRTGNRSSSNYKWIGTAIAVIAIIVIVIVALWLFSKVTLRFRKIELFSANASCSGRYKLMLFEMDGCPHCVNFKPEWKRTVMELEKDSQMSSKVCMTIVTAEEADKCKEYKVDGFPTVVFEDTKTKKRIDYKGPRTMTGLMDFMSSNVE